MIPPPKRQQNIGTSQKETRRGISIPGITANTEKNNRYSSSGERPARENSVKYRKAALRSHFFEKRFNILSGYAKNSEGGAVKAVFSPQINCNRPPFRVSTRSAVPLPTAK